MEDLPKISDYTTGVEQNSQQTNKNGLGDWLKSDKGKDTINDTLALAISLMHKNNPDLDTPPPAEEEEPEKEDEFTILWMNPLTFGIVAISALVITSVSLGLLKNKKPKITK